MSFRIETILIKDIVAYASSFISKNPRIIPITWERALSQQNNPQAQPEDPCLWVALSDKDDEVIGFCGSLPGQDVRTLSRMAWNSCWWVDPERGREAAMPLFYRFLQAWDYRVAFADMTCQTRAIVDQMGFCNTREERLVQSYLRLPVFRLLSSLSVPRRLLLFLILPAALFLNGIQSIRIRLPARKRSEPQVESRDSLDEELAEYIRKNQESDFSGRAPEEFRWIGQHPWLVQCDTGNLERGSKYPFSYCVDEYYRKWLVSRRNEEITSLSLVAVREGALKVLYFFGKHPSDAFSAIKTVIISSRIHSLIYAHPDLISCRRAIRPLALYSRKRKRYSGVSKKIISKFPDKLVMQLGDGDAVFT